MMAKPIRRRRWWTIAAVPRPPSQASIMPPLDILPSAGLLGAFSFRKLSSAYGGFACKVMRTSDSTMQDIGFVSGSFDIASFSSFVGGSAGLCDTLYDQSGNARDLAYNAAAARPTINLTGLNGNPTIVFIAANQQMARISPPSGAQPVTDSAVAMRTGRLTLANGIFGDQANNGTGLYFSATADNAYVYAGTVSANVACTSNTAHSLIGVLNGASSSLTVDGATTSGLSVGANGYSGFKAGNVGLNLFNGNFSEGIRWTGVLSGANIATLAANQKAYWGTS